MDEVKHMTTISTVQTLGLRRLTELKSAAPSQDTDTSEKKFSSVAGNLTVKYIFEICFKRSLFASDRDYSVLLILDKFSNQFLVQYLTHSVPEPAS